MNDHELEIKLHVSNLPALETKLQKLGAELEQTRQHEHNLRFDTPGLELTRQHRLIRLRKDHAIHLTYKGPMSIMGGLSSRKEIEFTVDDYEAARRFIKALGYDVSVIYEKYRTTYNYNGMHITLDELPYGSFIEIEGPEAAGIQEACQLLALDPEVAVTDSYLSLFERLKKALKLDFRDLTFENFEGLDIDLGVLRVSPADI